MTPEEAAQWMDEWTEAGATSGKFTSIAALIRAQAARIAELEEQLAAAHRALYAAKTSTKPAA